MLFSLENAKNAERLSHYDCHILHINGGSSTADIVMTHETPIL